MGQAALDSRQGSGTPPPPPPNAFFLASLQFWPFQRKAGHFVNYQSGSSADNNYGASGTETHSKI